MIRNMTLTAAVVALALLSGCKKQDDAQPAAEVGAAPAPAAPAATTEAAPAPAPAAEAPVATPAAPQATAFDIGSIPASDKPLPAWPYVALPAGYAFDDADELAKRSKDLARVPVWTGGELLWVEGKVFSDEIDSADDKTYSKFEVRKGVQQAVEALGGVRVAERSYDEPTYRANQKALSDFTQEFTDMHNAYWYDGDADTYVIRRADKAIWVVFQSGNGGGALMVAEGALPQARTK